MTHAENQAGNGLIITLVVFILLGVGAMAYISGMVTLGQKQEEAIAVEPAAGEDAGEEMEEYAEAEMDEPVPAPAEPEAPIPENAAQQLNIEEGNPVVAKIGGEEIERLEVFKYINNLPPQMRQQPVDQVFAIAQDQIINEKLLEKQSMDAGLENDPQVQEQLEEAKANIIRNIYLQKEIEARLTGEKLQAAYQQYLESFPEVQEVKASHILVAEESKAVEIIEQLKGGADFAILAQENSTDGSAAQGGDLGYFVATDVVKPFGDAAFALEVGSYTMTPVQSDFGFHVIKVEDKRMREPEVFETLKPFLEPQLRQQILAEIIDEMRASADIEIFDINGNPVEAAAE